MKKKLWMLLVSLMLVMMVALSGAFAEDADSRRVFDDVDALTDSEEQHLQSRIDELRQKYDFDFVIKIANIEGATEENLTVISDDFYDNGITSKYAFKNNGLIIFLNLWEEDRVCWFNGCDDGAVIFDNYFRDYMRDKTDLVKYLKAHDWSKSFDEILDYAEIFVEHAQTDTPYGYNNPYEPPKKPMSGTKFTILSIIEAGIALLIGKGYASGLRASMNTAIKRTEATEYIDKSSFNLARTSDMFMYSNVTRTPIPTETRSGGGGGSSIHMSSGGHSHSGSGIHF